MSVDHLLAAARTRIRRLSAQEAWRVTRPAGALLVDTRTEAQRAEQGEVEGAVVIDRTVLEWRLDPTGPFRIPEATSAEVTIVVLCRQGYSSSLAVDSLQQVGLRQVYDVVGGVEAWIAAGLPMHRGPADVRR